MTSLPGAALSYFPVLEVEMFTTLIDKNLPIDSALSKARQGVQCPGKPDKGQALGEGFDQCLPGIPHTQISPSVSLGLRFAPAQAADGAEGDQLPHFQIQRVCGVEVPETVSGEVVLDVLQFRWGVSAHGVDGVRSENLLLDGEALFKPCFLGDSGLLCQGIGDTGGLESPVDLI